MAEYPVGLSKSKSGISEYNGAFHKNIDFLTTFL